MINIAVFTGTRAEYGLMRNLMHIIRDDKELHLDIIVSGMHLSPEFGLTFQEIEADGFTISEKIEVLLSSDSSAAISKAIGLGMISFCDSLNRIKPDILILLGDRFESFAMAISAMLGRIPIAHLHGGEATYGLVDEPIRHAISKMSHIHFTSTEEYRQRVIQLGEKPDSVFNVGALGVEGIRNNQLLSQKELAPIVGFFPNNNFALVTFHPITLEQADARKQFTELLNALNHFPDLKIIFTKANADTDGRIINQLIDQSVSRNPEQYQAFTSMGQLNYLSAMSHAKIVVGNSSSGIIEAPSLLTPTINIGNRQQGRIQAISILNCRANEKDIVLTFQKAFSDDFQATLATTLNPYEKRHTAKNIIHQIKQANLNNIIKKKFYDIPFPRLA